MSILLVTGTPYHSLAKIDSAKDVVYLGGYSVRLYGWLTNLIKRTSCRGENVIRSTVVTYLQRLKEGGINLESDTYQQVMDELVKKLYLSADPKVFFDSLSDETKSVFEKYAKIGFERTLMELARLVDNGSKVYFMGHMETWFGEVDADSLLASAPRQQIAAGMIRHISEPLVINKDNMVYLFVNSPAPVSFRVLDPNWKSTLVVSHMPSNTFDPKQNDRDLDSLIGFIEPDRLLLSNHLQISEISKQGLEMFRRLKAHSCVNL